MRCCNSVVVARGEDEAKLRRQWRDEVQLRHEEKISFAVILHSGIIPWLNNRHRETLAQIFKNPVPASIKWAEIEALLNALGAEISEGSGSRVRISLNGVRAVFHRPHPLPTTDKGAVKSMRRFLTEGGIQP